MHVADASRAAGVISKLLSDEPGQRDDFLAQLDVEYERVIQAHERAEVERNRVTIEDARDNGGTFTFDSSTVQAPLVTGVTTFDQIDVADLVPYIDWTPFFHVWGFAGATPRSSTTRPSAMLHDRCSTTPSGCSIRSSGNSGSNRKPWWGYGRPAGTATTSSSPPAVPGGSTRASTACGSSCVGRDGKPNLSIADFVAPASAGVSDHIGAFAVTAGPEEIAIAERFEAANDDYSSILVKALADRTAEALAEYIHARVRREIWGYAPDEPFSPQEMIGEPYRGIRPAPGYPSQPDHSEKVTIFNLLDVERRIGLGLTESFAMWPGSSVSGLYFAHPEAKYFAVGRVQRDQVASYAERKNITLERAEQLLGSTLAPTNRCERWHATSDRSPRYQFVAMYWVSQNS